MLAAFRLVYEMELKHFKLLMPRKHSVRIVDAAHTCLADLYVDYEGDVVYSIYVNPLEQPVIRTQVEDLVSRMASYVDEHGWKQFKLSVARG
jgi:hypothetical protein